MHRALINHRTCGISLSCVVLLGAIFGNGCDSNASNSANSCPAGEARCACYANDTCNDGLTCASGICVKVTGNAESGGSTAVSNTTSQGGPAGEGGGASVVNGSGGATSAETSGGASPLSNTGGAVGVPGGTTSAMPTGGAAAISVIGGAGPIATGGAPVTIASGGSIGVSTTGGANTTLATGGAPAATGGAPIATGGALATVATGGAAAVNNSPVIDAFATCDDKIESNAGRSGKWYFFADSDFNATHAFGDPGTQWADHGCAAWLILGCTGAACSFAGLGLQLSDGNPYNLSSYAGLSIAFESKDSLYVTVKTSDGGNFGAWMTGGTGNVTRNLDFASFAAMANTATTTLNKSLITDVQFTIGKTIELSAGFGFAIHSVSLR